MPAEKIECLQWFYFLTAKTNDLNEVCGFFIFLSPKLVFVVPRFLISSVEVRPPEAT